MDQPGLLERSDQLGVLHECATELAATQRLRELETVDHHVSAILRKLRRAPYRI